MHARQGPGAEVVGAVGYFVAGELGCEMGARGGGGRRRGVGGVDEKEGGGEKGVGAEKKGGRGERSRGREGRGESGRGREEKGERGRKKYQNRRFCGTRRSRRRRFAVVGGLEVVGAGGSWRTFVRKIGIERG